MVEKNGESPPRISGKSACPSAVFSRSVFKIPTHKLEMETHKYWDGVNSNFFQGSLKAEVPLKSKPRPEKILDEKDNS